MSARTCHCGSAESEAIQNRDFYGVVMKKFFAHIYNRKKMQNLCNLKRKKLKKTNFFGLAIVAAPKAAILQVLSKAKNLLASVQLATGGWSALTRNGEKRDRLLQEAGTSIKLICSLSLNNVIYSFLLVNYV